MWRTRGKNSKIRGDKINSSCLSAKTRRVSASLVKQELEEAEYKPILVDLDRIFCVEKEYQEDSIADGLVLMGMKDPLILLSFKDYNLAMGGDQPTIEEPFVCYKGNIKLSSAKDLGYTAIDCIIADDIYLAKAIEIALFQGWAS